DVAMAFSFTTTAYVVGGQGSIAYMNDTWKYDGASDTWTQVQNFNGGGRRSAVSFAINGKGYVALGQASTGLKNDIWEYDPTTNVWTQRALFPGSARRLAVAFVVNNIAYVGTGDDGICKADMYAFDPSANSWTPKANFTGTPRYGAVGFSVNGRGYIGFGYDNTLQNRRDFYEYDPVANSWTTMNSFPGTARSNAVAVTCPNNKVYMGLGYDSLYRNDWWEFNPLLNGVEEVLNNGNVSLYPCPMNDHATLQLDQSVLDLQKEISLRIYDLNGNLVRDEKVNSAQTEISRGNLSSGVYLVNVSAGTSSFTKRLIVE
ncbi:MAG TPA: kelch repeat-containing protein, partial [Bacteroidia bacterium]|nr:kelch repeat-containing protein [Bacteroidia bacterium]